MDKLIKQVSTDKLITFSESIDTFNFSDDFKQVILNQIESELSRRLSDRIIVPEDWEAYERDLNQCLIDENKRHEEFFSELGGSIANL